MIGVFDSGMGGLTVLSALRAKAPRADVVYFGDTAHAPYGPRRKSELLRLTALGLERLVEAGATQVVSACNSVSVSLVLPTYDALGIAPVYVAPRPPVAAAPARHFSATTTHAELLAARRDLEVIEMVGPTAAYVANRHPRHALVVATEATVRSGMYQEALRLLKISSSALPIPNLAGLIERGANDAMLRECIDQALRRSLRQDFDMLVLGCTHYPLVRGIFEDTLSKRGIGAAIVDPADAVAERAAVKFDIRGSGRTQLIVSRDSAPFRRKAAELFPNADYTIDIVA